MRIALIGIGQAGGKIADKLLEYDLKEIENSNFVQGCVAVNTARKDLEGLEYVPEDNRELIGETMVKGNGVGADNAKGRDVMQSEYDEIISYLQDMPLHKIDAFVITAALGGGTGSGGLPVLSKELRRRYSEPVYGLGILPAKNEGKIYSVNAARSLESSVEETDNLLTFDNDLWRRGESIKSSYDYMNSQIAQIFGTLFASGEVDKNAETAQSVVDASEIINTLGCGGITSIGYAKSTLDDVSVNPGLIQRFISGHQIDQHEATTRMRSLAESAVSGRMTLDCNPKSTERSLVVFSGPSNFLTRKGTEEGTSIVEEKTDCMEVRGGDYPRNINRVSSIVVLSGVYDVPRIKDLQKTAVEADEKIKKARNEREEKLQSLLQDEAAEEIDSLLDL